MGFAGDRAGWTVTWQGAQREVLAGDIAGHVDVGAFAGIADVSGLGPLEGVRGEITIIDGEPSVARVADGAVVTERTFRAQGCFFVWAVVRRWRQIDVTTAIPDVAAIECLVTEQAGAHGIDVGQPVPFRLQARPDLLAFHVLDKRDDAPHDAAAHERVKAHFTVSGEPVDVIGFFSRQHRGVFTPRDANLHMHFRTVDGRASGHVDVLALPAGARLLLPDPGGPA